MIVIFNRISLMATSIRMVEYLRSRITGRRSIKGWHNVGLLFHHPNFQEKFSDFRQADTDAFKEDQVMKSVIPIIEGKITGTKCVSGNILFTNLEHLTDSTLVPGNPDLYYGARPEQLNRRVRSELSDRIVPSTQHDLPIVPNFFLAAKGPDGSIAVAARQASYDGALGAIIPLHRYITVVR
jgi:hypothetical protein